MCLQTNVNLYSHTWIKAYWLWFVLIIHSTMYDLDEKRDEWQEEIYENQARYPLSSWPDEHKSYWTNVVRCMH